ncbi:DHHA2 domain-containing protein [Hirsutella rhossiliensis]|uniref:DHHA2 domain-containing protein n=1 Tax=Hirsutella rhossiliensis TaxID=111463 RepID=A0A9P8MTD0_9HYPO|nr:DHHA2 domain-containing protein [Hirsutella rhossiliensis]KAH0961067.1 DHHA2 domain-containing protein [Hirsutella rhossiliensis]
MSAPPRVSLQSFLASARSALRAPASQRPSPLTFVVGNESADLDSVCCAIVYAYLRSHSPPRSSSSNNALHVPLANLPRADLGLRPELTAALGHAGLQPADLITLSDLPADHDDDPLRPADTRWVLVDHNALTGPLARFAPHVVGCVDHHADEGSVPRDAAPRVIEPCGSCLSLIVDETRQAWDALTSQDDDDAAAWGDDGLAKLGLAPILIDTANLGAADKVKDKDRRAVGYLEGKLLARPPYSRQAFFDELSAVKEDISKLSFRDILRKDYKQWPESGLVLGVSSIVRGLAYLVDDKAAGKPQALLDALAAWADERRLDIAALMTISHPHGHLQRHLLVWGRSPRGKAAVVCFADAQRRPLGLHTWRDGELDCHEGETLRLAWCQDELAASRKRVAPLLREAMKTA